MVVTQAVRLGKVKCKLGLKSGLHFTPSASTRAIISRNYEQASNSKGMYNAVGEGADMLFRWRTGCHANHMHYR